MNKKTILFQVKQELKKHVDKEYAIGEKNFFKEKIKSYGVRAADKRKVAREQYKLVKNLDKKDFLAACEALYKTGYMEESTIAADWAWRKKEWWDKKDFKLFEQWVKKYIDNWAKCDDFCTHTVGFVVFSYPELIKEILKWTRSKNRWVKRAVAVCLIYPFGKKKPHLKTIFKVAKILLTDEDDMVQKGYGWMLKEASNHNQREVFKFVMQNKSKMPRTALRYAIEKMPKNLKQQVMS